MAKKESWFKRDLEFILLGAGAAGFAAAMYCGLVDTKPVTIYNTRQKPKTIEAKVIKYEPQKKENTITCYYRFNQFPDPFIINGMPSANYTTPIGDNLAD